MNQINRRQFLKTSMVTGTGLLVAPSYLRSANPNSVLGVVVIGVGGRGRSLLNAFMADPRTEVRYIVEVDEKIGAAQGESVANQQGLAPKVVPDLRTAFESGDVEIMGTASPNHWHALSSVWAMQAGLDVYVEKPVSHNIAEGSSVVAAAKKYQRMCQVGTQCRSNPAIIEAMAFLHQGGIGEVRFARGLCYKRRRSIGPKGDYPIPAGVDFNLWSGPAPYTDPKVTRERFHYDWHWQRHYGNGDSGNQGPHQTDIARWGLGVDAHPQSVISYGGRLGYQAERNDDQYVDAGDTANTQVAIYDYGKKCMVFETRGLSVDESADEEINKLFRGTRGDKIGVIFYGTRGYLVQRTYTHCIAYDLDFNVIREFTGGGNHFTNFIDACFSRRAQDLNCDAWEGHLSAALAHLANISYYLGEHNHVSPAEARKALARIKSEDDNLATLDRTLRHLTDNGVDLDKYPISLGPFLKFNPKKEVFTNHREANPLVTREFRPGFVCPTARNV
jgi:predicted dehydrogenase